MKFASHRLLRDAEFFGDLGDAEESLPQIGRPTFNSCMAFCACSRVERSSRGGPSTALAATASLKTLNASCAA